MPASIRSNVIYAFMEKGVLLGGQFFVISLYIRLLPRAEFGYLGVAAGVFTLVNFLNANFEPIIIRERKDTEKTLGIMQDVVSFNYLKTLFMVSVIAAICVYYMLHGESIKAYALVSVSAVTICDILAAPFVAYASSGYLQSLCTKASLVRTTANVLLTCGLWYFTNLKFIAYKDVGISLGYFALWHVFILKKFPELSRYLQPSFAGLGTRLKVHFMGYTLWTHMSVVVSGLISRLDVLMLSFFVLPVLVGDYNIALSGGSLVSIIPMIVSYQNFVALSTAQPGQASARLENAFFRASTWISLLSILTFPALAFLYLMVTTGKSVDHAVWLNMILIGSGIIVSKCVSTPVIAYANTHGWVKPMAVQVVLPLLVVCSISYFIGAWLGHSLGLALANVVCGVTWAGLSFRFAHSRGYSFPTWADYKSDIRIFAARLFQMYRRT